jgi:GntR family transcriptional regulator, histidine utilization repressor
MRELSSPLAAAPASIGVPMSAYQAVKSFLKNGLAQGRWVPGTLMPSESELVRQFGLSRMTVNRALRELQAEGMIERLQGVGTFAAQLSRVASQLTIRDIHEEIEARGHRHHAKVIFVRQESVTAKMAEQFGLEIGSSVYHSVIVHHDNGVAIQCEDRLVNPICAPDYLKVDFTQTTPTAYLLAVAPFWQAQYTIESCLPTKQQANWLGVDGHLPCLVVVRRTLGRGLPITLGRLIHPGHLYQLEGSFAP